MVGNGGGFVEPLLPPLRSQEICFDASVRTNLLSMAYLIQDFASLCRKLQPHSRIVFVDMGAALDFHRKAGDMKPAVYITHMYQRFGFHFDHIYAFEMKPKNPVGVYSQIPDDLRAAYHWFNVGVDADPDSRNNPFNMLLEKFNEDDFIVVKLGKTWRFWWKNQRCSVPVDWFSYISAFLSFFVADIDTSFIEIPLAKSILQNEGLRNLIDCFYFEHHVFLKELAPFWRTSMGGSVSESLKMFSDMRAQGIASHYWP
jgi:hypothetical protein